MTSLIGDHGLIAIFLLMTVAAVLPAASEVTMLYGGALASGALAGHISLFGHEFRSGLPAYLAVVVTGFAGNTLGAAGGWLIGVRGGHPLLERYGRYIHITPSRIARAERWFARFEGIAVPLGFATPLIRSFVAIPAGILEIGFRRFLASAAVGIAVFCFVLAGIGWAVGSSWSSVHHDFVYVDVVVVLAVVLLAVVLVVRRRRSITMTGSADSTR
ncbi:MAG TPA: DedA family protein [Gaiellaceae bacterium]|nr:DedA family protein [Gaiellaceae bacterium]